MIDMVWYPIPGTDWQVSNPYGYPRKDPMTEKREYSRDEPVALDDRDPSNADMDNLVEPLEPDDNVFTLVNPEEGTLLETAPMQEPTYGD